VYVSLDGHQDDDYRVHLYQSADAGATWQELRGDLPAEHIVHVLREDPETPGALWIGTEYGLYLSVDDGARWQLVAGLPRLPVHDIDFNRARGDVIVATHARGIWILDQGASVPAAMVAARAGVATVLPVRVAEQLRRSASKAHAGDQVFRGENPPVAALIDLWLPQRPAAGAAVTIVTGTGAQVTRLPLDTTRAGWQRVSWNLRAAPVTAGRAARDDDDDGPGLGLPGRWVSPGRYAVQVTIDGRTLSQPITVQGDQAVRWTAATRLAWERVADSIAQLVRGADSLARATRTERERRSRATDSTGANAPTRRAAVTDVAQVASELFARASSLYGAVARVSEPPTADQRAQHASLRARLAVVQASWRALALPSGSP
jgi:hypothetical protein